MAVPPFPNPIVDRLLTNLPYLAVSSSQRSNRWPWTFHSEIASHGRKVEPVGHSIVITAVLRPCEWSKTQPYGCVMNVPPDKTSWPRLGHSSKTWSFSSVWWTVHTPTTCWLLDHSISCHQPRVDAVQLFIRHFSLRCPTSGNNRMVVAVGRVMKSV